MSRKPMLPAAGSDEYYDREFNKLTTARLEFYMNLKLFAAGPKSGGIGGTASNVLALIFECQLYKFKDQLDSEGYFFLTNDRIESRFGYGPKESETVRQILVGNRLVDSVVKTSERFPEIRRYTHYRINKRGFFEFYEQRIDFYMAQKNRKFNLADEQAAWTEYAEKWGIVTIHPRLTEKNHENLTQEYDHGGVADFAQGGGKSTRTNVQNEVEDFAQGGLNSIQKSPKKSMISTQCPSEGCDSIKKILIQSPLADSNSIKKILIQPAKAGQSTKNSRSESSILNTTSQDSPSGRLAHGSKSESKNIQDKKPCRFPTRCARDGSYRAGLKPGTQTMPLDRTHEEHIAVSLRSTAIPRNSTLDISTGIGSNQDTRDTLPTSPLRVSVGTESESSLENQLLPIDSKPKPWTLCQEAGSGEKEETGLNTKRRRSASLAKTGDVARLDRFRRRAKGQMGSAAAPKAQDLPSDPHRAISSGDPDALTHTSGHLAPKQTHTSNSYESDISHREGRKEDQRMESMSTPSQAPLSRIERMKKDLTIQKLKEVKNNPSQKKRTKEELAWKVLHFWNEQENLRTHRVKNPLSKTVKQSLALIEDAFKGKLHVDHDKSFPGRKFNYRNFTTAISKVNEVAIDPVFGKAQKWASELSLRNFLKNQSPIFCKDPDSDFAFRNLSPFLFFVDHDMEEQSFRVVGPNYDEKLISDVHDIIRESYDKTFPYNDANKKDVVRFIKYVDDFIKENKNGLDNDATIKSISREYCKFVFEENFNHKIGFLFYSNKHSEFFDYCLEVGVLDDEYRGRLFKNGSKYFFQLTDAERKAIKSKEKKAREEQERISEERRIAAEKHRKEELLKNPPKPYDAKAELEKKKRKQEVKSCTARKDEWRKKAKANGNAKEFDAIWFDWARETKIDLSKLDQLKQSIKHLL